MERLEPPDVHYFSAAMGWMELGNLHEAKAELDRISPESATHPDVLELRWLVFASEQNWKDALQTANQLIQCAADDASAWLHRSYAIRRAPGGSLKAAWEALLPAADRFPEEATIPYNLACYACQMQQLDEARRWIHRAAAVGKKSKIKSMACSDPDLEPLWNEIRKL